MKRKPHVMRSPRTLGDVYAVEFAPRLWGICRVIRATAIEIPAVFTRTAGMPDVDWHSTDLERWRVFFLTVGTDPGPPVIRVGNAPFATDAEADMPPTYRDPDAVEQRYTIEDRGVYRYTSDPADLRGIAKQVTLLPPTLGSFLQERYAKGALREVGVIRAVDAGSTNKKETSDSEPLERDLPGPVSVDPKAERLELQMPTIVFAKIVQPIGPAEREVEYEEPLEEFLAEHSLGEITGGGTMQDRDGSVLFAGIDIEVADVKPAVPLIARKLAELGAPDGSVLEYELDGEPVVHPIKRPNPRGKRRSRS